MKIFLHFFFFFKSFSIQGLGTDEDTLNEILASRTNREIRERVKESPAKTSLIQGDLVYVQGSAPRGATAMTSRCEGSRRHENSQVTKQIAKQK